MKQKFVQPSELQKRMWFSVDDKWYRFHRLDIYTNPDKPHAPGQAFIDTMTGTQIVLPEGTAVLVRYA